MRIVVVVLLIAACVATAVETAYQTVFRRSLLRLLERERRLSEVQFSFSRFGKTATEPRVSCLEDLFEAVRDRVTPESRLRERGMQSALHAYFFVDFWEEEEDFDRAAGWRGYLWSPRTWSFHSWPN